MKLKLIFFVLLTMSLGFHVPPDAFAAEGDVTSTVEINESTTNGPTLSNDDQFGASVANIGDLNGNAVSDIVVGAWGDDDGGSGRGALHIMFMAESSSTIASGGGEAKGIMIQMDLEIIIL